MSASILIIGGGITGALCAFLAAKKGHKVSLVHDQALLASTSAISAGMVAPAMEAINDRDPQALFIRLKEAEAAWCDLIDQWPKEIAYTITTPAPTTFLYDHQNPSDLNILKQIGAHLSPIASPLAPFEAVRVHDDWVLDAPKTVCLFLEAAQTLGVKIIKDRLFDLSAREAHLEASGRIGFDACFLAGGFLAPELRQKFSKLDGLRPIKGHLLSFDRASLSKTWPDGVLRHKSGYVAALGARVVFGATMQEARFDLAIEDDQLLLLKSRAALFGFSEADLSRAQAMTGVRAAFVDDLPYIGRSLEFDSVFIAAGLRRNGFIYAPFAACQFLSAL